MMKKKNVVGIIIIALFAIGIVAALIVYKKVQTVPEKSQVGEEPETVVLSADENPFGVEIKKINNFFIFIKCPLCLFIIYYIIFKGSLS